MQQVDRDTVSSSFDFRDIFIHLAFVLLALMASIMYAERMFADASYYLLHMVNKGWFHVEHDRLVLALSQVLPWIGVKFGMSMKTILILFSVGHVCFFYGIFVVCRYRYGDRGAGLLLILLQTLGLEMGYFTPMFELYYGAGMLVLFASILWARRFATWDKVLLFLSVLFILTSHPMAVMLWGFVLVLHALEFRSKYLRWYALFAAGLLLFLVYKFFASSAYEETKALAFIDALRVMPYGTNYVLELGRFMWKYYWELMILFVLSLSWMIIDRKYLKCAVVFLAFVAMLVIINGAHYGFQHSRYQEQVYFPLTWIVAFPLTLSLAREIGRKRWRQFLWIVVSVFFTLKVFAIINESEFFGNRIARMERLISLTRSMHMHKVIVGEGNVTHASSAGPNWSYGIETLLLSACDGKDRTVTICLDSDIGFENNNKTPTPDDYLMRKWDIYPSSSLNQRYFNLGSGKYIPLSSANSVLIPVDTFKSAITIVLPEGDLHMPRGAFRTLDMVLQNSANMTLPSDSTNALFVSYHWVKGEEMIVWDGHRTPLEVDIVDTYAQTIDVSSPERTGHYTLVVDIVAEGRGWFGIDTKKKVWVY